MRLDKFLAETGRFSRKEAAAAVKRGLVSVDGVTARRPDMHIDPETQPVVCSGEEIPYRRFTYLMLHKPAGVVSASEDPREETVISLLPDHLRRIGLFPCGRLDKDTTGLLILTNDGEGAHFVLSPKRHVPKTYYCEVAEPLSEEAAAHLEGGITLADGYETKPSKIELSPGGRSGYITLIEGKYHQIKRMMGASGNRITALSRITFGSIKLDEELMPGAWRYLTKEEENLFSAARPKK